MNRCLFVLLVACACPSKKASGPAAGTTEGNGTGSQAGASAALTTCESTRSKIEQLYRALAQVKEPKRVEESVADNVRMVENDCAKNPAKYVPCIAKVQSVEDLEKICLVPLDDEGTEGEAQKR